MILNFDERSARESAEQDWKIDLERESKKKGTQPAIEEESESDEESELDSDAESDAVRERDERIRKKQIVNFEKKS